MNEDLIKRLEEVGLSQQHVDSDFARATLAAGTCREAATALTEAEANAEAWHRTVEVILILMGLSPALGAIEAREEVQTWLTKQNAAQFEAASRIKELEDALDLSESALRVASSSMARKGLAAAAEALEGIANGTRLLIQTGDKG